MLNKKSRLRTTLLLFFVPLGLIAQSVLPSSVGNAVGTGGTACYTVGQMVTETNTGLSGSVNQGVQQPYEVIVISGLNETSINLICAAYPNPTKDYLLLKIENQQQNHFIATMYGFNGKALIVKAITELETKFTMTSLNSGVYFLKISNSKKEIKSFKILKN
jgi:hypothetical protein